MSSLTQFSSNMRIRGGNGSNVVISDSPKKSDNIVEQSQNAHDKGEYQKGWHDCQLSMQQEIINLQEQLQSVSQQIPIGIQSYLDKLESQMEAEVCNIAFYISRVILDGEMDNMERVDSVIRQAVKPILNFKGVKLHLHPGVVSYIDAGGEVVTPAGVTIIPDSKLRAAEVLVDSSQGIIDATLEGRLDALKDAFKKVIVEQEPENV